MINKSKITMLRIAKGMSQDDLARALNVQPATVSRWETGMFQPTPKIMPKLANLLGVEPMELMKGE